MRSFGISHARTLNRSLLTLALLIVSTSAAALSLGTFHDPQPVRIVGYDGDAMEPFLSRDGRMLFFNNRNDPKVDTDLFWAERIDGLDFRFRGPVIGANSRDLDAVASMDADGEFYFVSARDYARTGALIHRGRFRDGRVDGVEVVSGLASKARPGFSFDAEISADGGRLYYVESRRGAHESRLAVADRRAGGFVKDPRSDAMLRAVNAPGLVYAPATTADGLELFFTRAAPRLFVLLDTPKIYQSHRRSVDEPFGPPERIAAIQGFAEAPTISPDGLSLYYHALVGGRWRLFRVVRDKP